MIEPPSFVGAVQVMVISPLAAVALVIVGAPGAVGRVKVPDAGVD